jgi:hypothetical protein
MSICQRTLTAAATVATVFVAMPLMAPTPTGPTIIYVDDDTCPETGEGTAELPYCSIQTAIDNAMDGYEIVVAPGTYFETINFLGKAIWLHSSDGPEGTTIDGTGFFHVVQCVSGEGLDTVLDGFTITGGNADDFQDNSDNAGHSGGGMYNELNSPTVTNCTFSDNGAMTGGGTENFLANPTFSNCTFIGNQVAGIAGGLGGAMFNWGSNPTVIGCTFIDNWALGSGSGMFNWGSNPTVTDCTFTSNVASGGPTSGGFGGGMNNSHDSSPIVTNCTFSGNSATQGFSPGRGGGMFNGSDTTTTVTDCTFSGNSAFLGGGLANSGSNPTVTDCTFEGNTADQSGGGMYNDGGSPTVTNCTFNGNTAIGFGLSNGGGGMYNDESNTTVIDCTFEGNTADQSGGGMYNSEGSPSVVDCTFSGNSANGVGGGMAGATMVTGCTFSGNSAAAGGALFATFDDPTVIDCTFDGNSASTGGGIYNEFSFTATVINCTFTDNSANNGAGIYHSRCSEGPHCYPAGGGSGNAVIDCAFIGNSGTALHNCGDNPIVANCVFIDNTRGMSNVYSNCDDWEPRPVVVNCLFQGNSGSGGMFNHGASPTLANCTFVENSSDTAGGAIHNFDFFQPGPPPDVPCLPMLINCIVWGNSPDQIFDDVESETTANYCDFQGGFPGTGNIDADPLFVDPENGDYRLLPGSPCIDAADNTAIPFRSPDLDGNPRLVDDPATKDTGFPVGWPGPIVDMGAYEYQGRP